MADYSKFFPKLMAHEGGSKFTEIAGDHGGATKWGITLDTWLKAGVDEDHDGDIDVSDLKLSTEQDAIRISKKLYWDKVMGDLINSQVLAEFICDWAYNSGVSTAIKHTQKFLPGAADGIMGPKTVANINAEDPETLFNQLKLSRELFYRSIVQNNPTQEKFLKGWLNRNNDFEFIS